MESRETEEALLILDTTRTFELSQPTLGADRSGLFYRVVLCRCGLSMGETRWVEPFPEPAEGHEP